MSNNFWNDDEVDFDELKKALEKYNEDDVHFVRAVTKNLMTFIAMQAQYHNSEGYPYANNHK